MTEAQPTIDKWAKSTWWRLLATLEWLLLTLDRLPSVENGCVYMNRSILRDFALEQHMTVLTIDCRRYLERAMMTAWGDPDSFEPVPEGLPTDPAPADQRPPAVAMLEEELQILLREGLKDYGWYLAVEEAENVYNQAYSAAFFLAHYPSKFRGLKRHQVVQAPFRIKNTLYVATFRPDPKLRPIHSQLLLELRSKVDELADLIEVAMGRPMLRQLRAQPSHHYGILRDWNLMLLQKGREFPDEMVERLKSNAVPDTKVTSEPSLAPSLAPLSGVSQHKRTRLLELAGRVGGVTFAELQIDHVMKWSDKKDVLPAVKSLRRHLNKYFKSINSKKKVRIKADRVWLEEPHQE